MIEQVQPHQCRYRERLTWGEWAKIGDLRERAARRVAVCTSCGRERPARRLKPPALVEAEAAHPTLPLLPDAAARVVAAELVRRGERGKAPSLRARGLLTALAAHRVPSSRAEHWLETFLRAGWLQLTWQLRGTRRTLLALRLLDVGALEDVARPGEREHRARTLREAQCRVASIEHPLAREVERLLTSDTARALSPDLIRALAAVATHVGIGDVLPLRVVSARHLGDSKMLGRMRRRLEALFGPLEALGIREGAALVLAGGGGRMQFSGVTVDLARFAPFLGLTRETLDGLERADFPRAGLFVVENLTPFEACCRGEIEAAKDALVLWSAGYPGRGAHAIVECAANAAAPVRVWADLDLHGVRIARLIRAWVGGRAPVEAYRMAPADVADARVWKRLGRRETEAIHDDLAERPDAFLAETLRALSDNGRWVEQEALLGSA